MRKQITSRRTRNSSNLRSITSKIQSLKMSNHMPAVAIQCPNEIPMHIFDPPVSRTVRIKVILTNAAPGFALTPNLVALQDRDDYGAVALRYTNVRFIHVKIWLLNPPASLTLGIPGLIVTESSTSAQFRDQGTEGHTYPHVGFQFPFLVRSTPVLTTSASGVLALDSDQAIAAGNTINVIIDTYVEFR